MVGLCQKRPGFCRYLYLGPFDPQGSAIENTNPLRLFPKFTRDHNPRCLCFPDDARDLFTPQTVAHSSRYLGLDPPRCE